MALPCFGDTKEKGWILRQSTDYSGTSDTIVGPSGFKCAVRGLTVIGRTPFTDITIWNKENKSFAKIPMKRFMKLWAKEPDKKRPGHNVTLKKTGSESIAGFQTEKFVCEIRSDRGELKKMEDVWTTTELKAPPALVEMLSVLMGTPKGTALPLRVIDVGVWRNRKLVVADTLSSKRVEIDWSKHVPPKDYKKVASELELVMGSDDTSGGSLLNELAQ